VTTIFRNKTWLVTWANDRHTEIRVEKTTLPVASHGVSDYALLYDDGSIRYDHPGWVPDYVKEHVAAAFGRHGVSSRKGVKKIVAPKKASKRRNKMMKVYDRGVGIYVEIIKRRKVKEADVFHIYHPDIGYFLVVKYPDGTQFTPWDWQAGYRDIPKDLEDIEDWQDKDGDRAFVVNGLPRSFK
jgi:hypothetical protein